MSSAESNREALTQLALPNEADVSDSVRAAHEACLSAFASGDRKEAYRHMSVILRHTIDADEHLLPATQNLYLSLILNDAVDDAVASASS